MYINFFEARGQAYPVLYSYMNKFYQTVLSLYCNLNKLEREAVILMV